MYSNNLLSRKYLLIYSSGNSYLYICTYVRSSDLTSQWPAVHHPNKNIVSVQNDNKQRILNETFKTRHCLRVPKRFWANASDADYINKCFDPCQFEVLYIVLIYLYILSYSIITISPNIRLIMYSRPLDEKKEKTNAGKQSSFIGNLMIDPRWWMMKFNIFIFQLLILT